MPSFMRVLYSNQLMGSNFRLPLCPTQLNFDTFGETISLVRYGIAIAWCAVQEAAFDGFLQRIGLTDTGKIEEVPDSLIGVAWLDTGWCLFWYNQYDCPFLGEARRQEHSRHHDLLYCLVEEHCMASSSELWSHGSRKWWIPHQGIDGPKGQEFSGELPNDFQEIKTEMETTQKQEVGDKAEVALI